MKALFLLCVSAILLISQGCTEKEKIPQNYIAHGGGEYRGIKISNSREAVLNSLENGIRYIELDLVLTQDSVLVGAHDWQTFRELTDQEPWSTEPLSIEEVRASKMIGNLTPLTGDEIVSLMRKYPEFILVTDKISDPEILDFYFKDMRDRVIVECFSRTDYKTLSDLGYKCFMSSLPPSTPKALLKNVLSIVYPFPKRYVASLAKYKEESTQGFFKAPYKNETALYTAKNREEADSVFALYPQVSFVYIDDVSQ